MYHKTSRSISSSHSTQFNVNKEKEVEKLNGDNMSILRLIVGSIHVSKSYFHVARMVFKKLGKGFKKQSKPLRRGLVLAILETHSSNKESYYRVMRGI